MKIRAHIPIIATVAALLALVPVANAATSVTATSGNAASYIKVTTSYEPINPCFTAPDNYQFTLRFKSKIKRRDTARPKRVTVTYSVDNMTTGARVKSEKVTLKPTKYRKAGTPIPMQPNTSYLLKVKAVYRAPNTGKNITARGSETFTINGADQLATLGLPACPVG